MLRQLIDRFSRLLEGVIAIFLAIMVVLVFGNVVLRYGFNSGITLSEEVSRWLFVWTVFLGAVVGLKEHAHLGSDMLVSRLPVFGKKVCLVVGHVLMLYITWLFLVGSWQQAMINVETEAAVTGASMSIFYFSGVAYSVLAGVLILLELLLALTGQLRDDELVMVKESEEQAEFEALQAALALEDVASGGKASKPNTGV